MIRSKEASDRTGKGNKLLQDIQTGAHDQAPANSKEMSSALQTLHRDQPSTMTFWPFRRRGTRQDASTSKTTGKVASCWPSKMRQQESAQAHELRIATSGSLSINALVELLRVDGGGGVASQPARARAAIFAPGAATTIQFHPSDPGQKPGACARASCVHALRLLTPEQTTAVLDDVKRIGESIGWSSRGVSLPTQDVLVQKLSKESQDLVHRAIREQLLPLARRHYPHLNAAFDKQPYPRPGNLFIVRYCASSQRPGGRGLKLHKDETALTFNLCLSPEEGFTGGGTYFPANSTDVDGLLVRPKPGCCVMHDGNIKHAGNEILSGQRFILVGFYNADGRDRVGEEQHFSKAALEEQRARNLAPTPQAVQTIYFTTAVVSARGSSPAVAQGPAAASLLLPPLMGPEAEGSMCSADPRPSGGNSSSVPSQDPLGPTGAGASSATFTAIRGKEITAAGGIFGVSSARDDAAVPAPERPLPFVGGGCAAAAVAAAAACAAAGTVLYKPFESASDPRVSRLGDRLKEMPQRHSKQAESKGWGG